MSQTDRMILESYETTMDALAAYYGEAFEIVLHSLNDLDHSVIKIVNGFHSGRKQGAPITDFALSMLEKIQRNNSLQEKSAAFDIYFSTGKHGEPLKSTTIVIFGEKKEAIAMLCINLYLNSPISDIVKNFTPSDPVNFINETFITESAELIKRSLDKVKNEVFPDSAVQTSQKNKEIIKQLYYQGIFKLKNAVPIISNGLSISRNTIYMHLRTLEKK